MVSLLENKDNLEREAFLQKLKEFYGNPVEKVRTRAEETALEQFGNVKGLNIGITAYHPDHVFNIASRDPKAYVSVENGNYGMALPEAAHGKLPEDAGLVLIIDVSKDGTLGELGLDIVSLLPEVGDLSYRLVSREVLSTTNPEGKIQSPGYTLGGVGNASIAIPLNPRKNGDYADLVRRLEILNYDFHPLSKIWMRGIPEKGIKKNIDEEGDNLVPNIIIPYRGFTLATGPEYDSLMNRVDVALLKGLTHKQ